MVTPCLFPGPAGTKVRNVPITTDTFRRESYSTPTIPAATSISSAGKRPAPEGGRPKVFGSRNKHIAHKPKRAEPVTISEDPPSASSLPPPAPADNAGPPSPASVQEIPTFSPSSLPKDGADSGLKAYAEYSSGLLNLPYTLSGGLLDTEDSILWKKPKAFQASKPLILERVKNDFD
ncbi:hypothetical protein LIER_03859 [Lithospermum erythrorhizon]|uniref:Uncharacterized protein n=1 Tax=Lithospermum erythrorhizon TaxID=34254 RepID=A0AAV3NVY3_LITER